MLPVRAPDVHPLVAVTVLSVNPYEIIRRAPLLDSAFRSLNSRALTLPTRLTRKE